MAFAPLGYGRTSPLRPQCFTVDSETHMCMQLLNLLKYRKEGHCQNLSNVAHMYTPFNSFMLQRMKLVFVSDLSMEQSTICHTQNNKGLMCMVTNGNHFCDFLFFSCDDI